jgi:DNA-binding MarR family transcriptional regulator
VPSSDFDAALDALILASRAVVAVAARSLPPWADVSLVQFRALVLLERHGTLKPGALAEFLEVSPSTVTGLCDRLSSRRLIVRQPGSENRREVVVELSPTGKALVDSAIAARRLEMARILERVPAGDLQGMTKALIAIAEAAGESPEQAWSAGWTVAARDVERGSGPPPVEPSAHERAVRPGDAGTPA